jgi:MFS family permease
VLLAAWRRYGAVVGLSLDQLVAWGVLYYAYTILSVPVATQLGVSPVCVSAAFSLCLLVSGWLGAHVGPLLDTYGTRGVLRLGAIAAPLAFAALAFVESVVSLFVVFALLGVAQSLALYEPAFRTLVDWYPNERLRARAMLGLTSVGGFASTVFLPFTSWLLARGSWRETVLTLATLLGVLLIPLRFLLPLPSRGVHPLRFSLLPAHQRVQAGTAPLGVRAPAARPLAVGLALQSLASTGVFIYLPWLLVERGESLARAAISAGLAGAAQVPGRLVLGFLARRASSDLLLPSLLASQALALFGVVAFAGSASTVCILVFGASSGAMTIVRATVIIDWYGRQRFGAHQGRLLAVTNTTRAMAPLVVEAAHRVVSYASVFSLLGVALVLGAWTCGSAARRRVSSAR